MILVDPRAGSCELVKPLRAAGLDVEEHQLDSGDIHFIGRGVAGQPTTIGVEHKKVGDLINSLNTGRLQGFQMLRMLDTYDRNWLVIEGDWDHDAQGRVTVFKGRGVKRPAKGAPPAIELEKRLITLETRGGFRIRHCAARRDSIRFIVALYRFWTDRNLDEHKSHLAIHAPDLDSQLLVPTSLKREWASRLPGVGYKKSKYVDDYFKSIRAMANAPETDWAEIDGIGKKLAAQIVSEITREDKC